MLASSPSTIAETELALAPNAAEDPKPGSRWRRPRSQRLGIGAWLALIWLAIVILGGDLHPAHLPLERHRQRAGRSLEPGLLQGRRATRSAFDRNGNDMLLNLAKGARNSMMVGVGAVAFGPDHRRDARADRRLLPRGVDGVAHDALQHPARDPAVRARAVARHGVRARRRSTARGNQHPPSSVHRLFVLIFALGIVSIPILARITRANSLQWSQREFVLAARAQGATNRRDHVARGASQRAARDVLDRAARRSRS